MSSLELFKNSLHLVSLLYHYLLVLFDFIHLVICFWGIHYCAVFISLNYLDFSIAFRLLRKQGLLYVFFKLKRLFLLHKQLFLILRILRVLGQHDHRCQLRILKCCFFEQGYIFLNNLFVSALNSWFYALLKVLIIGSRDGIEPILFPNKECFTWSLCLIDERWPLLECDSISPYFMMVELNLVNWFFVQQESNFEVCSFLKENHLVELILFLKKNGWRVIEDGLQVA